MIFRLISAFGVSLAVTAAFGLVLVPFLRRIKAGQTIREDGPVWHNKKQGTPTMGGLMFVVGIAVTCFTVGLTDIRNGEYGHLFVLAFSLIYAAIGFLDDYEKVRKKRNLGLTAVQKFLLQLVVAIVFVLFLRLQHQLTANLYIPFLNVILPIPEPVYIALAAFIIVGTVNSVNITDGVDGLATGVTIPVAVFYAAIAAYWGFTVYGVFAAALAGALVGFLLFNFHPARVIMGDTGSLFLGAAVCAMAFALDMPLILLPLGIIYFIETLSDIIQVTYFKATHGKRIFKMAPLHHHLEMSGWSEYKLFIVFTAISLVFAAISFYGVYFRYAA